MNEDNRKFADELLAASLDHIASTEPRAGFQGRILGGVAARNRAVNQRNWAFGFALSAFAVVAMVVAVRQQRRAALPAAPPAQVAVIQREVTAPLVPAARPHLQVAKAQRPGVAPQRPQQFPTPAPISEQEKLLLVYVKDMANSVPASPFATVDKDLEIPELKIAALEIKDLPRSNDTQ